MTWRRIPITAGVVNTRSPASMGLGECEYVKNARLKPGDLLEIHRDFGRSELFSVTAPEQIIHMFVAAFESAGEFIVLVTADVKDVHIKTASVTGGGLTTRATYTHGGTITKADHQHRGDEYFIGTNATTQRRFVLSSDLSVREMGMDDSDWILSTLAATNTGADTAQYDTFVYWVTEYDSVNDLESGFSGGENNVAPYTITSDNDKPRIQFFESTKLNSNATHWRIYRHFCGNDGTANTYGDPWRQVTDYQAGTAPLIGGLVEQIAIEDTIWEDDVVSKLDPAIPYPQVFYNRAGVQLIDEYLAPPKKWHVGAMFNDCLIVSDGTLVRFSPPSAPEYQPLINAFYFLTERSDEVVALHAINDSLVAFTSGGVHRTDYLQHELDVAASLGRAQRIVSGRSGCVGRQAHSLVDVEGQERQFVAFLSQSGLRMTDGERVMDACPDWSVAGAGISGADLASCVLVSDPANHRLRLFVPNGGVSDIWDFYYHSSLLKNGLFRVFGPSSHAGLVTHAAYGYVSGVPTLFTASDTTVWKEGVGEVSGQIQVFTGWLRPETPFAEWQVNSLGVEHDADATGSITLTAYGSNLGEAEHSAGGTSATTSYEQVSYAAEASLLGYYLRCKLAITGHSRLGSVWADVEEQSSGAA